MESRDHQAVPIVSERHDHARRRLVLVRPATGGVAAVAARTAKELAAHGWTVTDIPLPSGGAPARVGLRALRSLRNELDRAEIVHVEFGCLDLAPFWFAELAVALRRVVVVAHDSPSPIKAPATGLIVTGTRWRDVSAHRVLAPVLDRALVSVVQRRAAAVVVLDDAARERWQRAGARNVVAVEHPADPPTPGSTPPSEGGHVLAAGYIGPAKGLDVLIDAWQEVGATTELPLVVAGTHTGGVDGVAYERALHERGRGLTRPPRWLGFVSEAELGRLFAGAAVVVLPYRRSAPASGALVRAMVEGRAVVATQLPGAFARLRSEVDALLVPAGDVAALGGALARLLHDPCLRDRLGREAADHAAARFRWPGYIEGLERAYRLAGAAR
ncbi:MAG: glycosyl transferase group 1 [Actinomycetia bacterium]|nr:glycosyl transferase group 1 [Actinomycetes bacterium]